MTTTSDQTPTLDLIRDTVPRCEAVALVLRGDTPTLWRCDSADIPHGWHESHYTLGGETGSYGWYVEAPVLCFHDDGTYNGARVALLNEAEAMGLAAAGELNAASFVLDELREFYAAHRVGARLTPAVGPRVERVHALVDELRASVGDDATTVPPQAIHHVDEFPFAVVPSIVLPTDWGVLDQLGDFLSHLADFTYVPLSIGTWLHELQTAVVAARQVAEGEAT